MTTSAHAAFVLQWCEFRFHRQVMQGTPAATSAPHRFRHEKVVHAERSIVARTPTADWPMGPHMSVRRQVSSAKVRAVYPAGEYLYARGSSRALHGSRVAISTTSSPGDIQLDRITRKVLPASNGSQRAQRHQDVVILDSWHFGVPRQRST